MGLGLWRIPWFAKAVLKEGPLEGYNIAASKHFGQLRMRHAAVSQLPPIPTAANDDRETLEVHFLSGADHIFQTIFCAYSLQLHADAAIRPVIHDDGRLDTRALDQIRRVLPLSRLMSQEEAAPLTADYLPPARFPALWAARERLVLMRKLMDVHASTPGWKLFLDSDMLFFSRPDALIQWLRNPVSPCCMEDIMNSYGYSESVLTAELKNPLPDFVNTGICGLAREAVDWERLDHWCARLTAAHGINHFLEQALTAMCFSETPFHMMPRKHYVASPIREQLVPAPVGVMHHYVADSRTLLYRFGWRLVLRKALEARSEPLVPAPMLQA